MRISIRRRFVFLSNPRCGSQSVRAMLDPYADILSTHEKPFHHHANARQIKRALRRLDFDWTDFYTFTTIRNPWKRAVSFWNYGEKNPASIWRRRRDETGDFATFCTTIPHTLAVNKIAGNGDTLIVNRVMRLEDMARECETIATDLGIRIPRNDRGKPALIHNNQSREADHRDYFTPETRALIADRSAADIELGGYRFDAD